MVYGLIFCSAIFFCVYLPSSYIKIYTGVDFFSVSLICIIIGILINNLTNLSNSLLNGINFSKKNLLQLGIIFLGAKLSFYEVTNFGLMALPIVLITFITVMIFTYFLINIFFLKEKSIILISIGTAICGITAILACASLIRAKDNEVAYATFVISIIGTIALFTYPYLSYELFQNNANKVGIFLGSSIHDTGQVIASSFIYASHYDNSEVINISIVTKLLRNSFLIILIPILSWKYSKLPKFIFYNNIRKSFPMFVLFFIIFSAIRSFGDHFFLDSYNFKNWNYLLQIIDFLSFVFLNIALVALGLSVNLKSFKIIGFKPLFLGLSLSVLILLVNILFISFL